MKKKLLSALLAGCLAVGCIGPVSAEEIETSNGSGTTAVYATMEAAQFSVTVPTSISVYVDKDGNVTFPDNIEIVNNSAGPVEISRIDITGANGWTKTDDTSGWMVNEQKFVMTLDYSGDSITNWTFAAAPRATAITETHIANVVFTMRWSSWDHIGGSND